MNSHFNGRHVTLSVVCAILLAARADGQATQTTVQLPTFEVFGVSTTVVVPDRGRAYLGGVNRSLRGQSSFGAPLGGRLPGVGPHFGNRGLVSASSAAGISAGATIIDHPELDRALLAEAARRRQARIDVLRRQVHHTPQPLPTAAGHGAAAEARRAATYLRRARQAEADGQPELAQVFYQRVVKHGNASLKKHAEARLAQLKTATTPARGATR